MILEVIIAVGLGYNQFNLPGNFSIKTVKQQYADSLKEFSKTCESVFETQLNRVAGCIKGWKATWYEDSSKKGNPIAEDAGSFRGSSTLQCGIYDLTEQNEADRFKTYDLPGIVANLDIEMWNGKSIYSNFERNRFSY